MKRLGVVLLIMGCFCFPEITQANSSRLIELEAEIARLRAENANLKKALLGQKLPNEGNVKEGSSAGKGQNAGVVTGVSKGAGMDVISDQKKPVQSPVKWKGEFALGSHLRQGNKDTYRVHVASKLLRKTDVDRLNFKANGAFGQTKEDTTAQNLSGSAQYDRDWGERAYWLGRLEGEYDKVKNLSFRATLGPGVGYRFVDRDDFKFSLETGPAFVWEKFSGQGSEVTSRGRIGQNFEYQLTESIEIYHEGEFLVSFQEFDDWMVSSEFGVDNDIRIEAIRDVIDSFTLRVSVENLYDNVPAKNKHEHDLLMKTAVVLKY